MTDRMEYPSVEAPSRSFLISLVVLSLIAIGGLQFWAARKDLQRAEARIEATREYRLRFDAALERIEGDVERIRALLEGYGPKEK